MHAIKLLQIARYIMFYTHIAFKKKNHVTNKKRCFKTVILGRKKAEGNYILIVSHVLDMLKQDEVFKIKYICILSVTRL